MPGQQKEERKHPGLKLNAYLKRKTYQYNGRCDAAPHKNTLGTILGAEGEGFPCRFLLVKTGAPLRTHVRPKISISTDAQLASGYAHRLRSSPPLLLPPSQELTD